MKRVRHLIEYACVRLLVFVVDRLPLTVATCMARRLADLAYFLCSARRRTATANIRRSGVAGDAGRIARQSFQHLAVLLVESLRLHDFLRGPDWQERVEMDIPPEAISVLRQPSQGVLVVSGHLGNWEAMGNLIATIRPLVGIARPMNNPHVERMMTRRTDGERFYTIPKYASDPRRLPRILNEGRILAMLIDQHARKGGVRIDFFGHPASTYRTAAVLHLLTRAPICFSYCIRTGPMSYKLTVAPLIRHTRTGNRKEDVKAVLARLNRELEAAIRAHPEQYLWAHRRWRDSPTRSAAGDQDAKPATRGNGT